MAIKLKYKSVLQSQAQEITPAMANMFLRINTRNRRTSMVKIKQYAEDMARGRWKQNGETIKISKSGVILDGQQRLIACTQANTPFTSLIVRGLDDDVQDTIDTGRARDLAGQLQIDGEVNTQLTSTVLKRLVGTATGDGSVVKISNTALLDVLDTHPSVRKSVTLCTGVMPRVRSIVATHHVIMSVLQTKDMADAMVKVWKTGDASYDGDAMRALRERIVRMYANSQRPTPNQMMRLFAYAHVKFVKQEPVKVAREANNVLIHGWDRQTCGCP